MGIGGHVTLQWALGVRLPYSGHWGSGYLIVGIGGQVTFKLSLGQGTLQWALGVRLPLS